MMNPIEISDIVILVILGLIAVIGVAIYMIGKELDA
jgi:hypothetical protein